MSLYCDGIDSYVTLGQPSHLNLLPTQEWTMMCWVKVNTSYYGTFMSRAASGTSTRQYQLTYGSPGPPYELQAVVGGTFYATGVKNEGIWHHCVLRNINNSGTYQYQMYQDGAAAGNAINTGSGTISCDTLFGARRGANNTDYGFLLTGLLTDIRFYDRPMSAEEIQTIYSCKGHDGIVSGLLGRYCLNEKAPDISASGNSSIKDISLSLSHGTPSGGCSYSEDIISVRRRKRER